jgi:hypothetical protein
MIIGFGNKARQGKDTCCESIQEWYGVDKVVCVNMADALRRELTAAIDAAGGLQNFMNSPVPGIHLPSWVQLDPNPIMTDPLLPHGKHPLLLQWWGTNYRRATDSDYWVKKFVEAIKLEDRIVVVSDVRFRNEAKAIRDMGGILVNVRRVNQNGTLYFSEDRDPQHPSETELDEFNWDYYLKAVTGQAAFLEQQSITLVEFLKGLENGS